MIGLCLWASVCWGQDPTIYPPSGTINVGQTVSFFLEVPCSNFTALWSADGGGSISYNYSGGNTAYVSWSSGGTKTVSAQVNYTCNGQVYSTLVQTTVYVTEPPPASSCITITYSADRLTAYLTNNCSTTVCTYLEYRPNTNNGITGFVRILPSAREEVNYAIPITAILLISPTYCN